MKSLRIFFLFAIIQFAYAGGIDHYDEDDDNNYNKKEVIIKAISIPGKFPGHIKATHAIIVDKHYFYSSGLYGIDSYGVFEKSLKQQIERIFKIIAILLEAAKLKIRNILTVNVIVDIEYYVEFFEIYEGYFTKDFPTIFIVEGKLPKGAFLQLSFTAIYGNIKYVKAELEDY